MGPVNPLVSVTVTSADLWRFVYFLCASRMYLKAQRVTRTVFCVLIDDIWGRVSCKKGLPGNW